MLFVRLIPSLRFSQRQRLVEAGGIDGPLALIVEVKKTVHRILEDRDVVAQDVVADEIKSTAELPELLETVVAFTTIPLHLIGGDPRDLGGDLWEVTADVDEPGARLFSSDLAVDVSDDLLGADFNNLGLRDVEVRGLEVEDAVAFGEGEFHISNFL